MVEPKAIKVAPKPSRELLAGTVIDGRYRVIRLLGSGGTAMVYEVEHARTGRRLALKVIGDQSQGARLEQEAKATAKLRSRHAVKVIDLGVHSGNPYLVMGLLEGESLRELLVRRGKLDLPTLANIVLQVAECLDEAHALGLVHRDLKPDNFHLHRLGAGEDTALFDVTVLDFGVVKMAYDDSTTQLTRTGSTVGTPFYMSLEQLRGASTVDAQSDVYSLSVLLYECFSGTVPFQAATLGDLVFAICSAPPVALNVVRPELPAGVSDVVMAGLSSSKANRPKSMREVAEAFRPHAEPAFSLWLRGESFAEALYEETPGAIDPRDLPRATPHPLSPKPGEARALPAIPRAPSPPKPIGKTLDLAKPGAKALEPPKITPPLAPTPAVGVSPVRGSGLRPPAAAVPAKPRASAAAPVPIDEPSTSRDDHDEEPASHARDRDTPTEMFVKDLHGKAGPPGMPTPSEPPLPSAEVDPAQYPTMNLETGEATAVLSLPMSPPSQPSSLPASSHEGAPDSGRPSLSGVAPTFGQPVPSFGSPNQSPTGQGYPYAPFALSGGFQPPVSSSGAASGAVGPGNMAPGALASQPNGAGPISQGAPRSIDVLMDSFGRKGNDFGARAITRFRGASPAQQALVVGAIAAVGAVILVTLVFLIFF